MAQFTNHATLSLGGLTVTSNTVTGELLETVTMTKTTTAASYGPDDDITYILNLENTGAAPVTGLTVTDDLGGTIFDGTTVYPLAYKPDSLVLLVNGVRQPAPAVTAGPPLAVTGLSIPAQGLMTLVYEAVTTDYAPPAAGGTITNTATATGAGLTAAVTASATLPAAEGADLTMTKSLEPAAVAAGDTLTYTFLVENYGNTAVTAADAMVMADTFSPRLADITVTYNGTVWTPTANYTYQETTGVFTSAAGAITVPAAASVQAADGTWTVTPGTATLTIAGTVVGGTA